VSVKLVNDNEKVANFFLELSSPIRIQILKILADGLEYRNSVISKQLGISPQESLRHLQRLQENNLIDLVERQYKISPIGTLILEGVFPMLEFLIKHQDFFRNHDLNVLPINFTKRFSEISDNESVVIEGPSEIIALAEQIIEQAEFFCYDIAKLVTRSTNQLMAQKNDFDVKRIEEKGSKLKVAKIPDIQSETRIIDHIDIAMVISEKEAYIRFPQKGSHELSLQHALYSKNINFVNFCKDLFFYYWEQSVSK
jgi:predicted transcriptional regulator